MGVKGWGRMSCVEGEGERVVSAMGLVVSFVGVGICSGLVGLSFVRGSDVIGQSYCLRL